MAWISKKKLAKKITELEEKINKLDPQKIAKEAIKNLEELPKDVQEQIRGIIRSETENLNDRLGKNETETKAQKEKHNNLCSRIKENGRKVVNGIVCVLEEVFGPILKEKPEETISPDEPETEETSDDKEITAEEQVSANEETNSTGSEQQNTEEEVPDGT